MDVIRSNYSTLSKFAQLEAPVAPQYPYTEMMKAYESIVEKLDSRQNPPNEASKTPEPYDLSVKPSYDPGDPTHQSNQTISFQRILKHFFNDYFRSDADDETSADMARRWVAFARTGDPNYEDSVVKWLPWRYISGDRDVEDFDPSAADSDPLDGFVKEEEFWTQNDDGTSEWDENRFGQVLRERALQALNMEVVEDDELRTELRFSKSTRPDPDNPFFSLKFLSHLGLTAVKEGYGGGSRSAARRKAQRAAQEMGVLGRGVRGDERSTGIFLHHGGAADDFFPQLLELMWPPEGRLVERDCTCDFWDRIRCK